MKEWLNQAANIAALTAVSLAGIVARHAQQGAATGKMQWRLLAMGCLTAPALGLIAGGVANYLAVPIQAQWAIVALLGFLGPPFVTATAGRVTEILLKKAGG